MRRAGGSVLCAVAMVSLMAPALAQGPAAKAPPASTERSGSMLGFDLGSDSKKPIAIEADQGIEWQQTNHLYIARGHATAKRGNGSVTADTLTAHYRSVPKPQGAAATQTDAGKTDAFDSGTQIYLVEAEGHVELSGGDNQHAYGDRGVYDVDAGTMVLTGSDLRLTTKQDTVTARDSLEWHDKDQLAVARGNASAIREGKHISADVMTAEVTRDEKGAQHISRIDAEGNVFVSSQDQSGRGDRGVYNVDTGITTLIGHVKLTRGQNELRGQYAVVDMNKSIYRLLGAPPSDTLTSSRPTRVEGLFVPRQQQPAPSQGKP
ncbi:MAG TPA: LptA/OstA family protein [Stellaceae bacterium]|nr:LptA/OstA family protein [Stellaceae bacterium]